MKKNKIILKSIVGLSLATIVIGASAGVITAVKTSTNYLSIINVNEPVMFDNKQFNDYESAYDYARKKVQNEEFNVSNKKLFSLTVNNATHIFDSSDELNSFISSQIKTIPNAATNDIFHNLNEDKSIPVNELYKYNINTNTDTTFENNTVDIYKRSDGSYFAEDDALLKAKKSYLEIHRCYNFNGIYFKTLQDLEIYLNKIYGNQIIEGSSSTASSYTPIGDINNYKKIVVKDIANNPIATSESIYFTDNNTRESVNNFLSSNAYKYLRIANSSNSNKDTYLKFNKYTNQIEGILGEHADMNDLPAIKKVSTDNKSLYVVDANVNEKYNFYGPYFLKSDGNISNITNPDLWTESNDSPEEIIKSQSISILAGLFDLLLMDPTVKDQYKEQGNGTIEKIWDGKSPLFYISSSFNDKSDNILPEKERTMLDALTTIYTAENNSRTLFDDFKAMYNNLINTKSYSTVYAIPTIYNYLIDNLIDYSADVQTVMKVREYFDELCKTMQDILESIFGDLLKSYDGLKRFNFAKFFQINQYGTDGTNLNGILNGYELIKIYKPLIAGCYVLTKAIGNTQFDVVVNYKVKEDENLFDLLADGKANDQVTAKSIKEKWSNSQNQNKISIIEQLQSIYDTYSQWGVLTNKYVGKILDELPKNDTDNENQKIDAIYDKLIDIDQKIELSINNPHAVDQSINSLSEEVVNRLKRLKDIISYDNEPISSKFEKIIDNQFKNKMKTNLKHKEKSVKNCKNFMDSDSHTKSEWNEKDGLLDNADIKTVKGYKDKLSDSLNNGKNSDFVKDSSSIESMDKIETKDIENNIQMAANIISDLGSIANTICNLVNDINNPFFDDVQDQLCAAGAMNICSSICSIASEITPPPVNIIFYAISTMFSFISAGIGTAKQVIWEYKVNDSNGTKYYWDGGLIMNRFWGAWKDEQRGIQDLKMQTPIELINSSNNDIIYFNHKNYSSDNDDILRKDALKYIIDNNLVAYNKNSKYSWVYSLEPNINKLNLSNTFNSIDELTTYVINKHVNTISAGNELFINGEVFVNYNDFLSNMKTNILDKIRPIFIAKIPELDNNGYPIENQSRFHIPFPYYEPFNNNSENLVYGYDNNLNKYSKTSAMYWRNLRKTKTIPVFQNQKYIAYNTNTDEQSSYSLSFNQVYQYIESRFYDTINIETKKVLKSNLLSSKYKEFDKIPTSVQNLNIYLVQLIPGIKKYFINRNDAVEYILKTTSNNGDLKLNMYNKNVLSYTDLTGKKLYFDNQDQFNKWFINSIIKLN